MENDFKKIFSSYDSFDRCMVSYYKKVLAIAKILRNKKILDVGCAFGNYTSLFNRNGNTVFGLDIHDDRNPIFSKDYKFILYEGKRFPFNNAQFDVVTNFDVIEHIKNDRKFVLEIKRVLKKGGVVYCATPNRNRLASVIKKLIGQGDKFPKIMQEEGKGGKSVHEREYTQTELYRLHEKAGLANINMDYCWMGVRGKFNIGTDTFVIPYLSQTLFLRAEVD